MTFPIRALRNRRGWLRYSLSSALEVAPVLGPGPWTSLALALFPLAPSSEPAQEPSRPPGDTPGEQGRTVARPMLAMDHGFLRSASLDLLGRPPFRAEAELWVGKGFPAYLDEVLGSREFWDHWLNEQLYYFLLIDNFTPESERVRAIPGDLQEGRLDVREAVHRIAISASFDRRNPGADTFVTVVMEQIAGMTVQKNVRELEIGKRLYDGGDGVFLGSSGGSQADVVEIAVESRQFAQTFLEREYQRLLRQEPERKTLRDDVRKLHKKPRAFVAILRSWLVSPAYQQRLAEPVGLPNRLFVRSLFVDMMDRLPTPDEAEPLREALDGLSDSAPLRSVLVRLLIDSGRVPLPEKDAIENPTAWTGDLFLRLLGREATQDELKTFVTAFHDPACRPETVVYAILSSPEYHLY